MNNLQGAISDMANAMEALRLELPVAVFLDVNARWQTLLTEIGSLMEEARIDYGPQFDEEDEDGD